MAGEALVSTEVLPALHMSRTVAEPQCAPGVDGRKNLIKGITLKATVKAGWGMTPWSNMVWTSGAWRTPLLTTPLVMPRPCGQRLPRSPSSLTMPSQTDHAKRRVHQDQAGHDPQLQGSTP